jgi:RHS repeat-associated protein
MSQISNEYLIDEFNSHAQRRTDERGKVTETFRTLTPDHEEAIEVTSTNGVEAAYAITTSVRNGPRTTYREWPEDGSIAHVAGMMFPTAAWSEETRSTSYAPDGRRIERIVTESSDNGVVTNSVSTYDLLGRLVTVATPAGTTDVPSVGDGATGTTDILSVEGWLVTSNAYNGASTRILSSTFHAPTLAPRTTFYIYNDLGEQVGTVLDGVTNRTDTTYETDSSNVVWRVVTSTVVGPSTNSLTITRTRLTGLSDACRRHMIELVGRAAPCTPSGGSPSLATATVTETLVAFDPSTGIETETVTSSIAPTIVRCYLHGVLLSTETNGETAFNSYDAFGRLAATGRTGVQPVPDGATGTTDILSVASYSYSPNGDLLAAHTYTNGDEVVSETYAYDMFGNRIATTDALGNTIYRTYDPLGNVLAEWGATYPVLYTYDTAGRRTSLTTFRDAGGSRPVATDGDTTTWSYDPRTSLCLSKTYADGSTVAYTYTPDNLPLRTTYASGSWKENVYDTQRRLTGMLYSSSDMVCEIENDVYGRTTYASNCVAQTDYCLNAAGAATNETRITENAVDTIARTFDGADRLTGLAITGQGYAQYIDYSTNGLLTSISNSDVVVAYDYSGDLKDIGYAIAFAGGGMFTRTLCRDPFRRDIVLSVTNACGASNHDVVYSYDALSRPVSRNFDTFGYNDRSEVSEATIGGNIETHEYDAIGNSLLATFNAETNTYTVNNVNQYTSVLCASAPLREMSYDPDGNLTFDGVFTYAYDADNRLSSVSSNGLILATNQYDHKGRRIRKTTQTTVTTFLYHGWNLIYEHEVVGTVTNETFYYWGKDLSGTLQGAGGVGGLLYLKRNGVIYVPHADAFGNILRYADTAGNIVATYVYDTFGRTISTTGPLAHLFRHRFSTKYFDAETSLYYYGYRFYHPILMRWLNRDPIEECGGLNVYEFCGNSPVDSIDTLGLAASLQWNITHPELGLLRESLWDFLNGGESKIYAYTYPDSATTRLLGHSAVNPIWQEFKSIKRPVPSDYSLHREINYTARFNDFLTDVVTGMGMSKTDTGAYDFGVNVLGSFSGTATIHVRKSNCEKQLKMSIRNVFSVESMFRNPYTREATITRSVLNPVTAYFTYDITEPL